jgi:uncharacterized phage protein gp47/JayE
MTLALQIGPAGATAPSYANILTYYQDSYSGIYGSDSDLTEKSQDGQFLVVFSQAVYDANQMGLAVYSSFSPSSAQGAALSSLVKINGLRRKAASQSTATVTVTGVANSVVVNGLVGDNINQNTQWALPPTVTIPSGGSISAVATCTLAGATASAAHTLTEILNPQLGWQTADNAAAATIGDPVETDPQLLARQQISVAAPSITPVGSLRANLAALAGVGHVQVYENDTGVTDSLGLPPHSVSAVVEGGTAASIAQTIQNIKSIGCSTCGTSSLTVLDQNGMPKTIKWYPLATIPLTIVVHLNALSGYNSTTATYIKQALSHFVSEFGVGESSYLSRLYSPAQLKGAEAVAGTGLTQTQLDALSNTFSINSILQARTGSPSAANAVASFYEIFSAAVADISVVLP